MKSNWSICTLILFAFFGVVLLQHSNAADVPKVATGDLNAVESDIHEYMEYAFEPFFHQLKTSLAQEPADKKAWVPVKANALILAENGNLLLLRGPDEKRSEWNQLAIDLREQGGLLYQAAKKRDFVAAKKEYVSFVAKCNACHTAFAEGEHMQKP